MKDSPEMLIRGQWQGLQDHVTGSVSCIAGAPNRSLAVVAGVATKAALINSALGCAVEGEPHFLEVKNRIDCFFAHDFGSILVNQIVATLDRVECVPLPVIFFDICQRSTHATLGSTGVGSRGVKLGENGGARPRSGLKSRPHASATRANYHNIVNMCLHVILPS